MGLYVSVSRPGEFAKPLVRARVEALCAELDYSAFSSSSIVTAKRGGCCCRSASSHSDLVWAFGACDRNLVDPASSHMLVSKIKPCMSQYKSLYGETANGSLKQL